MEVIEYTLLFLRLEWEVWIGMALFLRYTLLLDLWDFVFG